MGALTRWHCMLATPGHAADVADYPQLLGHVVLELGVGLHWLTSYGPAFTPPSTSRLPDRGRITRSGRSAAPARGGRRTSRIEDAARSAGRGAGRTRGSATVPGAS